ncbi:hypothetical protein F7725_028369 [Dissostichus mawsoni]|uniref:Uncharacterized protein n=1 Tax=Dissostichus mawsoni TaxID=36200 RepID=A0A7J5XFQ8_DISMA|nr:hypothetical protein F7725_028369 [Dissostichus mawsoni]
MKPLALQPAHPIGRSVQPLPLRVQQRVQQLPPGPDVQQQGDAHQAAQGHQYSLQRPRPLGPRPLQRPAPSTRTTTQHHQGSQHAQQHQQHQQEGGHAARPLPLPVAWDTREEGVLNISLSSNCRYPSCRASLVLSSQTQVQLSPCRRPPKNTTTEGGGHSGYYRDTTTEGGGHSGYYRVTTTEGGGHSGYYRDTTTEGGGHSGYHWGRGALRASRLSDTARASLGSTVKPSTRATELQNIKDKKTTSQENEKRGSICCPANVFISSEEEEEEEEEEVDVVRRLPALVGPVQQAAIFGVPEEELSQSAAPPSDGDVEGRVSSLANRK